ncbi:Pyrrolo-quinoline quinone, partial [Cupriavidus basilensis OR16]
TYTDTSDLPNASSRTISFTVNDGTTDSAIATKLVSVDSVNDSPVNAVPAAQSVDQNSALTFSAGNGNLISVSDVDSGGGVEQVTLTAAHGVVTLPGTSGLTFLVGSGTGDATMTFTGTLADINAALNGLVYTPTPGYHGAGSIQITTNDQGLTGSGGAKTATDTIAITVNSISPVVTNVDALTANGTYKVGDTVSVVVTFDQAVTVDTTGGTPTLLLETGAVDRNATYISGSGTNTLTFRYTVQAGDSSADLDVASSAALALNGGVITNASSDAAVLTLPAVGGAHSMGGQHDIVVDGIAPTVATVSVPANGTYATGQNLDFTVNYGENVVVDTTGGTPRIAVTLGTGGTVYASYLAGSGTSALTFRLTVASGQLDSNGVSVASTLDLHGGTVRDVAGNDAVTTLNSVASTTGVLVDAVAPSAVAVIAADPTPTAGNAVHFTVTFSENVTGVDVSDFVLSGTGTAAGQIASVTQVDGHTYSVVVNNVTGDGQLGLDLKASGTGIADTAGNAIAGGLAGQRYVIDHTAPVVLGVSAPAGGDYNAGKVLDFTVSLSENTVIDTTRGTPRLVLDVGGQTVYADYMSGSGTTALTFRYIVAAGQNDANGIAVTALQANGGTMRDSAGNAFDVSLHGVADTRAVTVDTTPPTAVGIARVDASPTSGSAASYTVTFAEGVTGVDAGDFALTRTGSATGIIGGVTQVDARTYTVLVTGLGGSGQIGLTLNASGTGIADRAGNPLAAGASGDPYEVRSIVHLTTQPAPAPVPVPGPAPLAPAPSAPLITLTALDSAPGVDAPTLNPPGNGAGFSPDAVGRNPFNADPLSAGSLSFALLAPEGRMGLVEVGSAGSIGLQAMPEIGSFSARAGEVVSIALPASLFRASDREATVTVEVRLANGRPLPPWLKFDPVTGTLTGKPPQGMSQKLQIEVSARDNKGNRASSHLDLNVKASADSRAGLEHADTLARGGGSHADPLAGLLQAAAAQPAGKPALAAQFDQFGRPAQQAANAALLRHLQMSRQPQTPAQAQAEPEHQPEQA